VNQQPNGVRLRLEEELTALAVEHLQADLAALTARGAALERAASPAALKRLRLPRPKKLLVYGPGDAALAARDGGLPLPPEILAIRAGCGRRELDSALAVLSVRGEVTKTPAGYQGVVS
jgi:hypothetical protein